jgi:glycosyltransferase involved in cell wall biosynthesis
MKVLHVTLSSSLGGGPQYIHNLLGSLSSKGVECFAAAPHGSYNLSWAWKTFSNDLGSDHVVKLSRYKFNILILRQLSQFVLEKGINVVHAHGRGAGLFGRLLRFMTGVPCVLSYHGVHYNDMPYAKRVVGLYVENLLKPLTCAYLMTSASEKKLAASLGFTVPDRTFLVNTGLKCAESPVLFSLSQNLRIAHITRFEPAKNSLFLINIANALREAGVLGKVHFFVCGDGPQREHMQKRLNMENLESSFSLLGYVPDVRELLRSSHCYIGVSLREGMPLALLEAMAEGLPVVASDVDGHADLVIHGQTGLLFPYNDARCAAVALQGFVDDMSLLQTMGLESFKRIRSEFSQENMISGLVRVYKMCAATDVSGFINE